MKFKTQGKQIFITAFPKSGSTYLSNLLSQLTGFHKTSYIFRDGLAEQEIYYPKLIDFYDYNVVIQQHSKANDVNINLLNEFKIKPIVLTRNIFDVVISLKDHLDNEDQGLPFTYFDINYSNMDKKLQYDMIIDLSIPWYIAFYVSWFYADKEKKLNIHWLAFENFIQNNKTTVIDIFNFYNLDFDQNQFNEALRQVNYRNNRFNKGIIGRGINELTILQKNRIKNYTKFYPDVDFSLIGL